LYNLYNPVTQTAFMDNKTW